MRCALDATPLLGARTGVAAFVSGLLGGLAKRENVEPFGYALSWRGRSMLREVLPVGVTSGWSVPAAPLLRLWAHSSLFPAEWIVDVDGGVDVVHGTNFVVPPARAAARVLTVHDLTCVRYPSLCTPTSRRYPHLIERAVRQGAWVHAPSQFVADEVREHFNTDRVRAIPHGITPVRGRGPSAAAAATAGATAAAATAVATATATYILGLGTIEPRKDFPLLVRAFDAIDDPDISLVIAGADGWQMDAFDQALKDAKHRDRIQRMGYVDDETRADLIAGAAVFAYPSVYEGFGLPPLEAMAAGVPVVATDVGAIPEVCGDGATLVAPGDVAAFTDALTTALSAGANTRGIERAALFTWDKALDGMEALYADCLA